MEHEEKQVFLSYLKSKGFKKTPQRQAILDKFLELKGHVSADELYREIRRKHPNIGHCTVYRALKLFQEAKIAGEVNFTGKRRRFEKEYSRGHHDHLICLSCGKAIEVYDQKIESLQDALVKKHGFVSVHHRMEIFGKCKSCASRKE